MDNLLIQMLDKYSKHFITAVMVFVKQMKEYYDVVAELIEGVYSSNDDKLN